MNRQEYKEYQESVERFFEVEGIDNLSMQDPEEGEAYFSWNRCDVCNRSLGGDRYECNGYNPTTKKVQEGYEVCQDCYYYAEYGKLDDMTMIEIEDSEKDLEHYKSNPYAWPGGYQVNALMADGEYMCHECICKEDEVFQDDSKVDSDDWRFITADVYWEGPPLYCAHCNKELISEYGDPDEVK